MFYYDLKLFKKNPVVIDAGARYGDFIQRIFGETKGKDITIFAIEPEENACNRVLSLKKQFDFVLFHGILWHRPGSKTVYMWDNPQNSIFPKYPSEKMPDSRKTKYAYKIESDCITLDKLVEKYRWIDLLKMNIEGSEYPILENTSEETLGKIGQIAVEAHTGYKENYSFDYMLKLLDEKGFDALLIEIFDWEQGHIYARNRILSELGKEGG